MWKLGQGERGEMEKFRKKQGEMIWELFSIKIKKLKNFRIMNQSEKCSCVIHSHITIASMDFKSKAIQWKQSLDRSINSIDFFTGYLHLDETQF